MPTVVGQDKSVFKRVTCRKCGSINEYAPNEVMLLNKGRDDSGNMCETHGIVCAGCSARIVTYSNW